MASNKTAQAVLAGNNLIIVLMLVSFLAVGATVLIGKSLVTTIFLNKNVLDAKIAADNQLSKDLTNAPKLVNSYGQLGNLGRIVDDALPTTKDIPSVLVTLENMGLQSGLTIKSVTPLTTTAATSIVAPANQDKLPSQGVGVPPAQSFRLAVAFNGTYSAMQKFMADVELSARPMKVVNMQLSGSGNALSGQVEIQTYFQAKATLPIVMEEVK